MFNVSVSKQYTTYFSTHPLIFFIEQLKQIGEACGVQATNPVTDHGNCAENLECEIPERPGARGTCVRGNMFNSNLFIGGGGGFKVIF